MAELYTNTIQLTYYALEFSLLSHGAERYRSLALYVHMVRKWNKIIPHKLLVRSRLEDHIIDRNILLKWLLRKYFARAWTELF
jgi:hypothetical protein